MDRGNTRLAQFLFQSQGKIRRIDANKHVRRLIQKMLGQSPPNANQLP